MVGDEGADAAHMRLEGLNEFQVLGQTGRSLVGRAYHKAAAHLEADVLQVLEALHPVCKGHGSGVELLIMRLVRRLVAEQVAVCPGVIEGLVICPRHLPQGEGHGAVGVVGFDGPKEPAHAGNGKGPVLAALENEGAKAQPVALGAAGENILVRQAVAVAVLVRPADAAVVAVVFAVVCKFNDAAEEHATTEARLRALTGKVAGKPAVVFARVRNQPEPVFMLERLARRQGGDHALYLVHGASSDCAAETGITSAYAPSGVSIEPMTARTPK